MLVLTVAYWSERCPHKSKVPGLNASGAFPFSQSTKNRNVTMEFSVISGNPLSIVAITYVGHLNFFYLVSHARCSIA